MALTRQGNILRNSWKFASVVLLFHCYGLMLCHTFKLYSKRYFVFESLILSSNSFNKFCVSKIVKI